MQLNINELNDDSDEYKLDEYNLDECTSYYDECINNFINNINHDEEYKIDINHEKLPENNIPIKVVKKNVHYDDSTIIKEKPLHQSIPKVHAKMVRPQLPLQKLKISYDEILSKMGMFVSNGKLHLIDDKNIQTQQHSINANNIPNNSYIYNKYFKDEIKTDNSIRKPKTLEEYKMMVINDYLQRHRIKQMKTRKLLMPTSNINMYDGSSENFTDLQNKFFNFSKR